MLDQPLATSKMIAEKDGAIGRLIFNNPARHNAVSLEMWEAVTQIMDDFERRHLRVQRKTRFGGCGRRLWQDLRGCTPANPGHPEADNRDDFGLLYRRRCRYCAGVRSADRRRRLAVRDPGSEARAGLCL